MGPLKIDTHFRPIEFIAFDVENAVPARAVVLKRDLRGELHQLLFGELVAEARVQVIGDVGGRLHHGVGQFQNQPLRIVKYG